MEANGETIPEGFLRSSQPGTGFLIRPEGEETEEDVQMKMQAFSKKRETLKLVFLSLCALEDEAQGIRDAMREKIQGTFDEYYKEGSDFCTLNRPCADCTSANLISISPNVTHVHGSDHWRR